MTITRSRPLHRPVRRSMVAPGPVTQRGLVLASAMQLGGAPWDADVCIAGAGPIGLSLAAKLAGTGMRVLVLEAGGSAASPTSQAFYAGEVVDPAVHWPLDSYRVRALGG
ncbi:MAG: FAD-dependent monooxygenase, partial [Porphyrobacter sp.]|nr:FAD-dependent monooxygenase [Porphyrobacter sp.]